MIIQKVLEKNLLFIEKCLKKFDYPNLYGADLAEILGGPNRVFLLSWIYKLLVDEESSDDPTIEVLTNFINLYGFCSTSQTKQFIEMTLDYSIQIQILYRMFNMLSTAKNKSESVENSDETPLEAIDCFLQKNVNIFKSYGPMKISDLDPKNYLNTDEPNESAEVESKEQREIKKLSVLKEEIDCASNVIIDLSQHIGTNINLDLPLIEGEIDHLKVFNESLTKAKGIIENTQKILSLKGGIVYDEIIIPDDNEYTGMAKDIIKLINEI